MPETVVSIDIGSSSMKAAAIGLSGQLLARARRRLPTGDASRAAADWPGCLKALLQDLSDQDGTLDVAALCISGNGPTLVGGDDAATLLWNAPVAGDGNSASLFIPRIVEFKRRHPDSWQKSRSIYSGPEYLIHELTGADLTILPEERYATAYWTAEALLDAGFTEEEARKLPPFAKPGSKAGCTKDRIAPIVGSGVPVYCGAPDFISALVGTNCLEPGQLCDRAGSSEGINFCSDVPLEGTGIRTLPSVVPGLWNASVLLPESGSRFSRFKEQVEQDFGSTLTYEELVFMCIHNPSQEAIIDQGKYLMLQTAMQVRDSLKVLLSLAAEKNQMIPDRMTVTGGQAANDEWNQMKSNVTGMAILVPECSDAELLGDAVFAFTGMGLFPTVQEGAKALHSIAKCFEPEAF
ncbi:MAG: hypothetical protein K6G18_10200 [Treponema sp.]|nr:hypothetical protein [Treponema sp.]